MAKNRKKLAATIMLAIAGTICLIWFVLTLRAAILFQTLGSMEGDDSFWGDIFAIYLGTVYGSVAIWAWIETIAFAIAGGLLLFASYKAWKSKWGKKRGAFIFALVVLILTGILALWSLWGFYWGGLVV